MAAIAAWTREVICHFFERHIPVVHFQQELKRALQPGMQATDAGGFNNRCPLHIPKLGVISPRHQKSSAEGMRL